MARPRGFEPPTARAEIWCSIQLNYGRASSCKFLGGNFMSINSMLQLIFKRELTKSCIYLNKSYTLNTFVKIMLEKLDSKTGYQKKL